MTIEHRFLQKAIQDRNFISFSYENKTYEQIKPEKITQKENDYLLFTNQKTFTLTAIKKLKIHKDKF